MLSYYFALESKNVAKCYYNLYIMIQDFKITYSLNLKKIILLLYSITYNSRMANSYLLIFLICMCYVERLGD